MKSLSIINTKLSFGGSFALNIEKININSGEITSIIGPNGSGKSTLLKIIAGITIPSSGNIKYGERSLTNCLSSDLAKIIAYVGPAANQNTDMNVFEVVATGRYPHTGGLGFLNLEDRIIVDESLSVTGLDHLKTQTLHSLSSGELQRVFIARAITQNTPIIVLDEPVANVDPKYTLIISNILKKIKKEKIIIIVLHDINLAINISDKIIGLKTGEIFLETNSENIDEIKLSDLYDVKFCKNIINGKPLLTFINP